MPILFMSRNCAIVWKYYTSCSLSSANWYIICLCICIMNNRALHIHSWTTFTQISSFFLKQNFWPFDNAFYWKTRESVKMFSKLAAAFCFLQQCMRVLISICGPPTDDHLAFDSRYSALWEMVFQQRLLYIHLMNNLEHLMSSIYTSLSLLKKNRFTSLVFV